MPLPFRDARRHRAANGLLPRWRAASIGGVVVLALLFLTQQAAPASAQQPPPSEKRITVNGTATQQRLTLVLPSSNTTVDGRKLPLVVQLNGFCENAVPTAPMQADLRALVNKDRFAWMQINAPKVTRKCQLCPLTIRLADQQGLPIYAASARMLQMTVRMGGCNAWNATTACCNAGGADGAAAGGDVAFVRAAIAQALAAAPAALDPSRVFLVGIASGGFMALKVACADPRLVRGVVAYAAASEMENSFAATCPPGPGGYTPPVLLIHGTNDVVVPPEGDVNNSSPLARFPSADTTLLNFVRRNGCGRELSDGAWSSFSLPAPERARYDTRGSPFNYNGYYQVRDLAFRSCAAPSTYSSSTVQAWRVEGGNHFMEPGASRAMFKKAVEEFLLPLR